MNNDRDENNKTKATVTATRIGTTTPTTTMIPIQLDLPLLIDLVAHGHKGLHDVLRVPSAVGHGDSP